MAKGTIDPAFQAAPFLGESTHDPIEFQRRHKAFRYQQEKIRQEKIEENIAKGLEKLMIDVKSWEDKEGFNEIVTDHDKVIKGFLELSKKGLNVTSPKTSQEIMAYKTITEAQQKIMNKVDVWNRQKDTYDLITQALKQDSMKRPEEQNLERDKIMDNIFSSMKGKSILDREMSIDKILVFRPQIGDMWKHIADNAKSFGEMDVKTTESLDEETGRVITHTVPFLADDKRKRFEEAAKGAYRTAKDSIKESVRMNFEQYRKDNPDDPLSVGTPEEYYVEMAKPKGSRKYETRIKGAGGGIGFNFFGQRTTSQPGTIRNPITYGTGEGGKTYASPYEFQGMKPIKVNWTDPTDVMVFYNEQWSPVNKTGDVEAELRLYDSEKDEFVFRTTQQGEAPFTRNNVTFSIPRAIVGDRADELPIVVNGKVKKLKDIYGPQTQPKEDTSVFDIFTKKTSEPPPLLKRK